MGGVPYGDWPFRERAVELRLLTDAVLPGTRPDSIAPHGPHGAVVVAPAGVGKTRLLREVVQAAEAQGMPTSLAIATRAARDTPYGALAHLVPDTPAEHANLSSWYRSVAAALHPDDGSQPLVAIDDAHLLDEHSAALVLHLALTGAATVLATVRRGESVPDPITALWKDGLALRVDLQSFSTAEIGSIIAGGLGGEVAGDTLERLARLSGGNALFAREMVLGALDAGTLTEVDGVWRWNGSLVLAPRLVDAVSARIGHLEDQDRSALALLALGEPLPLAVATEMAGEEVLARLEAAGLIDVATTDPEATCRLAHPLYGDVVLSGLGGVAQASLTLRLADAMEAAGLDSPEDVLRITTWRLDHGGAVTPKRLTLAAGLANGLFDPALAEKLARAALDRGGPPRAAVERAASWIARNRFAEAEAVLADAEADILAEKDDIELHHLYLSHRHAGLYMGLRRRDDALAMLDRFEAAHSEIPEPHRAKAGHLAAAHRAQVLMDDGKLTEVLRTVRPILEAPQAQPMPTMLALELGGEALAHSGHIEAARALHQRLEDLTADGGPEVRRARSAVMLQECMCLTVEGRLDDALALAETIRSASTDEPDPHVRALVALGIGAVHLLSGRVRTARRILLDAVDGFRHRDSGHAGSWAFAMLSEAEAMRGDVAAARSALDRSVQLRSGALSHRMMVDFALAAALIQVAEGDTTGAIRTTLEAAEQLDELVMARVRLLHAAVSAFGAPPGPVVADLRAMLADLECELPALLTEQVEALADHDADKLADVSTRLEPTGAILLAAEAAAQASRQYQAAGRQADARREAARSRALAARCEGARTPGLELDVVAPVLSRRESEVARLAAQGLSNAEIAERLTLSVRTVESHLYHAFGKLGVSNRAELDAALDQY